MRLGAAVTYAELERPPLADLLPALAEASRTVGSPQIRNRGTLGGNLGTASPAGDALPPLLAEGAEVVLGSVRGVRELPLGEFLVGPKRNALAEDELVLAVRVRPSGQPQTFMKVGPRNAMVIAVVLARARRRPGARRAARRLRLRRPRSRLRHGAARRAGGFRRRRGDARASDRRRARHRRLSAPRAARPHPSRARALPRLIGSVRVALTVNGEALEADAWAGESLLVTLRDRLGLPGSKNACEQGECGSCSVLLDGVLVCACLVLAVQADGHEVVTVEGLAADGELHPVQRAFAEAGAVQCGFCTPGLVVAAADLLGRNPRPTDDEIREALSGNICRCTGYAKILDAVRAAAPA